MLDRKLMQNYPGLTPQLIDSMTETEILVSCLKLDEDKKDEKTHHQQDETMEMLQMLESGQVQRFPWEQLSIGERLDLARWTHSIV